MDSAEKLMLEIEHLKTSLKEKDEAIKALEDKNKNLQNKNDNLQNHNDNLKKLEAWYVEQLKLKAQQKFGKSSEKNEGQISLFDLFNEAEELKDVVI